MKAFFTLISKIVSILVCVLPLKRAVYLKFLAKISFLNQGSHIDKIEMLPTMFDCFWLRQRRLIWLKLAWVRKGKFSDIFFFIKKILKIVIFVINTLVTIVNLANLKAWTAFLLKFSFQRSNALLLLNIFHISYFSAVRNFLYKSTNF